MPTNVAITARKADPGVEDPRTDPGEAEWTDDVVHWPVPAVDTGVPSTTVPLTGGTYTVAQRARSAPALVPSVQTVDGSPALVLSDPTSLLIDGETVSSRPDLVLPVSTDEIVAVTAGTRTVSLDGWRRETLPGATAAEPRPPYLPIGSATPI